MKTGINKSAKRAISLVIAFALLIGSLFTANVGITINAGAETTETVTEGKTVYLKDGTLNNAGNITNLSLSSFTKDADGNYIIDSVEKLAYVCVRSFDSANLSFKVADDIDAFVLQTESYASGIKDLADYNEVKAYFEENATNRFNWSANNNTSGFRGSFDGNGVAIYGMYANGCLVNFEQPGLFPMVEGGAADGDAFTFTNAAGTTTYNATHSKTGTTIKNFAIYNSYVKGYRRVGIVIGTDNWTEGGYNVEGFVNLDSCVVGNCYVECVDNYTDANNTAKTTSRDGGEAGLFAGGLGNDPLIANNVLVYGSYGCFKENETDTEVKSVLPFIRNNATLTSDDPNVTEKMYGKLYNAVLIDVDFTSFTMSASIDNVSNVYTNSTISSRYAGVVMLTSADAAKGMVGRTNMGGLNWADAAENPDDGSTYWYYQENDYPTPIRPASDAWKSVDVPSIWGGSAASAYASGSGANNDPYIIKTAEQLYKMVTSSGKLADGSTAYYKVADGVEKIYLNNIFANETLDQVKALVAANDYKNWAANQEFFGNFDGNGVTLSGMVSYNQSGFVKKMSGASVVKNVHFENTYIYDGGYAAVVTTDTGTYTDATNKPTISNVSVRNSYIESTQNDTLTLRTTTDKAYTSTDADGTKYVAGAATGTTDKDGKALYYIDLENGQHSYQTTASSGGIVAFDNTAKMLTINNCLFDGYSCKLVNGSGSTVDSRAGIIAMPSYVNNLSISNCVSLGYPVVSAATTNEGWIFYNRYNTDWYSVDITNSYTDIALTAHDQWTVHNELNADEEHVRYVTKTNTYTESDFVYLDYANNWSMTTVENGRIIPIPKASELETVTFDYSNFVSILANYNGVGLKSGAAPNQNGTYGWVIELVGSGTKSDPYIIDTATKLAIAIATGGRDINDKLYYKLACDINLGSLPWLETETEVGTQYKYTEFVGVLDGDGHTVYGLNAVDSASAGLVPVLAAGGTVKNLHVRNSYAGSPKDAGIIAGTAESGSVITGCSVESSTAVGTTSIITGSSGATINDCYYIVDGSEPVYYGDTTNLYSSDNTDGVWYKGKANGEDIDGYARLVNFAKAQTITDIDGDGVAGEYGSRDIAALRNNLLKEEGYENIYGDVSGDGIIGISDLAILRREIADDYNSVKDGFWRNVELGAVKIYYAENDTQDMARKMELYLESVYPQTDVVKVPGTAVTDKSISDNDKANYNNEQNAIVITQLDDNSVTDDNYGDYTVNYDASTNVLTIDGGSFTAVEQAVLDFISNAKPETNTNPVTLSGDISTTKPYKTIVDADGNTVKVYYAWGDEFADENKTGTYSTNNWTVKPYKYEGASLNDLSNTDSATGNTTYLNLENPNADNLPSLWEVHDGKLTIWRGINTDVYTGTEDYSWGYKGVAAGKAGETNDFGLLIDSGDVFIDPGQITTEKSMMFKQGYSEMRASLPSDGHAFPAWWFMTGTSITSNASWSQRLYSKVYKLNENYDGTTTGTVDPKNRSTYKYENPMAYLEFDIVEFMQAQSSSSSGRGVATGNWKDYIQLTIHKYYSGYTGNTGDYIYLYDWANDKYLDACYNTDGVLTGINRTTFNNTAGSAAFIHRYNPSTTISNHAHTTTSGMLWWAEETETAASYSIDEAINNGALASGKTVTDYYTYGFYWTVDEGNKEYDLIVYVDFDEDGNMQQDEIVFHVNEEVGHESTYNGDGLGSRTLTDYTYGTDAEFDTWNQYAFMLLDNAFYTSNGYGNGRSNEVGVTPFTDLLTKDTGHDTAGATDKTTFDIEYVRVYQENGRRDLVTTETEAFNTNDHFGYGDDDQ